MPGKKSGIFKVRKSVQTSNVMRRKKAAKKNSEHVFFHREIRLLQFKSEILWTLVVFREFYNRSEYPNELYAGKEFENGQCSVFSLVIWSTVRIPFCCASKIWSTVRIFFLFGIENLVNGPNFLFVRHRKLGPTVRIPFCCASKIWSTVRIFFLFGIENLVNGPNSFLLGIENLVNGPNFICVSKKCEKNLKNEISTIWNQ